MAHASGHIHLRRGRRGGVWFARYRLPSGRQVKKRLGRHWAERGRPPEGFLTKKMAEAKLRELLVAVEHGDIPDEPARTGSPTFADAVEAWLESRGEHGDRPAKPSTLRDYRNTSRNLFVPAFGADTPVGAITEDDLVAYQANRLSAVSRRTAQKEMVLLHGVLEVARKRGWIETNPCSDLDPIQVKRSLDFNVLTPSEVYAVAEAAPTRLDRAVVITAAFTGLRFGELRALRWDSVRFDLATLLVRGNFTSGELTTPKSGKVRSVPLMDDAAAVLDELSKRELFTEPGDLVFPSPTGGYRIDHHMRDPFYAALAAAGLGHLREKPDPFVFHDLRHTFGTIAVRVWPVPEVQLYMGHADIQTTMRYVHFTPRHEAAQEFTGVVRKMASVEVGLETGLKTPIS